MKVYCNAHLWLNGAFSAKPGCLIVNQGKIEKILPHPTVQALPNSFNNGSNEVIDLCGAFVYPGFIDTHTHSFEGGLYSLGVDLAGCVKLSDVFSMLAEAYGSASNEELIFAWQFDENAMEEKRFPLVPELDRLCPNKPLILRRIDGHSCVLNSFARRLVPELDTTEEILRGSDNDTAVHHFHSQVSGETILKAYQAAAQIALKGGFTGIHTMIGDAKNSISHYSLVRDNLASFAIDFVLYPQSFNLKAALDAGATRIGGCILADGSIGSQTAALSQPYLNSDSFGVLYQNDMFWLDFISAAHQHNLQVGVHCIGDLAIRQINKVYQNLSLTSPKDLRHQLIHCELTDDALLNEISVSGAVPVMQPNFDLLWGGDNGFYTYKLGLERSRIMNRLGSFAKLGVKVTGGSDWYVTALDAVMSIQAAMHHHNPGERLTHRQAVDIYTTNAAWLSGDENRTGAIIEGYAANFTVLSHALDTFSPTPKVLKTIRNGETIYEAKWTCNN